MTTPRNTWTTNSDQFTAGQRVRMTAMASERGLSTTHPTGVVLPYHPYLADHVECINVLRDGTVTPIVYHYTIWEPILAAEESQ